MTFYDALAADYHRIYPDWNAGIQRQANALDQVIRAAGAPGPSVLDASCGIGTQSLGLAALGYTVTASDLSPQAVERARSEARQRHLTIDFSVADMRSVWDHHQRTFDVVLAADNSVPHLLSDGEILTAFEQFHRCTVPGGICLISVRDYEALGKVDLQVHPHGVREEGGTRYVLLQVWEWHGALYDATLYVIEHEAGKEPHTRALRTTYYAVPIPRLMALLREAGFDAVERIDGEFFQPLLLARKAAAPAPRRLEQVLP